MIEKKTVLDQIEVQPNGIVQARFLKQLVENGNVLSQEYHRTVVEPGVDVAAQMAVVNAHLQAMGCAPCQDYKRLSDHVAVAQTPDVVAAFRSRAKK